MRPGLVDEATRRDHIASIREGDVESAVVDLVPMMVLTPLGRNLFLGLTTVDGS